MTTIRRRTALVGLASILAGCATPRAQSEGTPGTRTGENTFYQVSTIDALACGHFSDDATIDEVIEHGGFGLGTVDGVDGELVIVDDDAYAVRGDGTATALEGSTETPFAAVTAFEPETTVRLENVDGFSDFAERLTEELPRTDHFYALNVTGTFEYLRTRSVERQIEPYPTLEDVLENETVFEFQDVEGDMPTFYIPEQFERIHPPGYHAHFITADRDGGGHVYDFRAGSVAVEIDRLESVHVELPEQDVESYPPC